MGLCGVHHQGQMYDVAKTVKIAAYVTVKNDGKPNCKQINTVFNEAKAGNNKFEEYVNDLFAEAGLGSDFDFNINDMRMVWVAFSHQSSL